MTDNDENAPDPASTAPRFCFERTDAFHLNILMDGHSVATACTARTDDYTLSIEPAAMAAMAERHPVVMHLLLTAFPVRVDDLAATLAKAGLPEAATPRVIAS